MTRPLPVLPLSAAVWFAQAQAPATKANPDDAIDRVSGRRGRRICERKKLLT
ncbi:MAG: hypothetical protein ABSG03_36920 [Bryobacteraceae bacterium]|jgi:hypothetical protein